MFDSILKDYSKKKADLEDKKSEANFLHNIQEKCKSELREL